MSYKFIEWRRELYGLRKIKTKPFFFSYLKGRGQGTKIIPGTKRMLGKNLLMDNYMS